MRFLTPFIALIGGSAHDIARRQDGSTDTLTSTATIIAPTTLVTTTKALGVGEPVKTSFTQDGSVVESQNYVATVIVTITTTITADPTASSGASSTPAEFICSPGTNCQPAENTFSLNCPSGQPCSWTTVLETYSGDGGETCTPSMTTATLTCSTGGSCDNTLRIIPILTLPAVPLPPPEPVPPPVLPEIPTRQAPSSVPVTETEDNEPQDRTSSTSALAPSSSSANPPAASSSLTISGASISSETSTSFLTSSFSTSMASSSSASLSSSESSSRSTTTLSSSSSESVTSSMTSRFSTGSSSSTSLDACSISAFWNDPAISASIQSWIEQLPFTFSPEATFSSMSPSPSAMSTTLSPLTSPRPISGSIKTTVPFIAPSPATPGPPSTSSTATSSSTTSSVDTAALASASSMSSVSSASSASSWSKWASSTCQSFTVPTPTPGGVNNMVASIDDPTVCAYDFRNHNPYDPHKDYFLDWPKNSQFFWFTNIDPITHKNYAEEFCNGLADNQLVLGPDGLEGTRPGACQTFAASQCLPGSENENEQHQCLQYSSPASTIYSHAITFAVTWTRDYTRCSKRRTGTKIDRKRCMDVFNKKILARCKTKDLDGLYGYIGGDYGGDYDKCLVWSVVSIREAPPNAWF